MSYTPGPWSADAALREADEFLGTWFFGPDGSPIAGTSGRIKIADAHLIAAAPDLYEALRELVRVVDGTLQGYGIMEPSMEKARAALSKAEGKC